MQKFLVCWTAFDGREHFSEYDNLDDAMSRHEYLKGAGYDWQVYLSVVIDYE